MRREVQENDRSVIVIVKQDGCPACADYAPRFSAVESRHDQMRQASGAPSIPVIVIDAQDPRPEAQQWMNQYKITSLPSTLVLRRPRPFQVFGTSQRWEGAVSDYEIARIFAAASN